MALYKYVCGDVCRFISKDKKEKECTTKKYIPKMPFPVGSVDRRKVGYSINILL